MVYKVYIAFCTFSTILWPLKTYFFLWGESVQKMSAANENPGKNIHPPSIAGFRKRRIMLDGKISLPFIFCESQPLDLKSRLQFFISLLAQQLWSTKRYHCCSIVFLPFWLMNLLVFPNNQIWSMIYLNRTNFREFDFFTKISTREIKFMMSFRHLGKILN